MVEFEIPDSLKQYFSDKKVQTAVNDLVDKLDGDNMIECDWSEAREYNQALLFATQVRADFIDLLFEVWESSFGKSDLKKLGIQYFGNHLATPKYLWEERSLENSFYRDGSPDDEGRSECLIVWVNNDKMCLQVYRFADEADFAELGAARSLQGWQIENEERGEYVSNIPAALADFVVSPEATIQRFRDDAKRMIEALAAD